MGVCASGKSVGSCGVVLMVVYISLRFFRSYTIVVIVTYYRLPYLISTKFKSPLRFLCPNFKCR